MFCLSPALVLSPAIHKVSTGGGLAAEGEDIEVLEMTFNEALAAIDSGAIVDGKTIMLLYYVAHKGIL